MGSLRRRGVTIWPHPKDIQSPWALWEVLFVKVCPRTGQGICDPHPPLPDSALALSSWELWLGRRERQLELLQAFPGLPQS